MPVSVKYLHIVGNRIYAHGTDDTENEFVLSGGDFYVPGSGISSYPAVAAPTPTPAGTLQDNLVAWCVARIGAFAYWTNSSQGDRTNPDVSGATDCSGLTYRAYLDVAGVDIGTWTGAQYDVGTNIAAGSGSLDESLLVKGDLVFYDWSYNGYTWSFDHVEMYIGSDTTIGHGGHPYMGPVEKSLSANVAYALRYRVQRYV